MMLIVPGLSIGFRRETDPEFRKRHLWLADYFPHFIFFAIWAIVGVLFIYAFLCPTFGWPMAGLKEMIILAMTICLLHFPISAILMSVAKDKYTTFQLVLALSVPCFMISGYVWPQYSMPGWVASMSDWFLINPIGQALRKVIYKGQTIQDLGVEYQHILRIFVAYCIAALVIVHRGILYRTVKRIRARKSAAAMPVEQKTATSNGG
jgi:ABC-type multidrug transport system permease subunit